MKQVAAHQSETDVVSSSPVAAGALGSDTYEMDHRNCVIPHLPGPGDASELYGNARA